MEKTLFWVQNESPTIPNIVGIDGEIYVYKPEPFLDKAVFKRICNKYNVSANFILVWDDNFNLLIQSVFQDLDEGGMPQTFRFRCNTIDPRIVCGLLEGYAKRIGKTLRDNELENISSIIKEICVKIHKRREKKLFGILLFVSIIVLFFIWKNCCMDKSYKLNKTNVQEITVGKEMQDSLTQTYR